MQSILTKLKQAAAQVHKTAHDQASRSKFRSGPVSTGKPEHSKLFPEAHDLGPRACPQIGSAGLQAGCRAH